MRLWVAYKVSQKGVKYLVNDPNKCKIYELTVAIDRDGNKVIKDKTVLASFCLKEVKVIVDKENPKRCYYSLVIAKKINSKEETEELEIGSLDEIATFLVQKSYCHVTKEKIRSVLSYLIEEAIKKRKAKIVYEYTFTGFTLNGNRLILSFGNQDYIPRGLPNWRDSKVPMMLYDVLTFLDRISEYFDRRKFYTVIYWLTLSPLAWVRRLNRSMYPHIILYGYRGTGKSTLATICRDIFGLSSQWEIGDVTLPRLVRKVDATTFPIFAHECSLLFRKQDVGDTLNLLATETKVRDIAISGSKRAGLEFYARAPIMFITNELGFLSHGGKRRFLKLEFTRRDVPSEDAKKEFRKEILPHINRLPIIGMNLIRLYFKYWDNDFPEWFRKEIMDEFLSVDNLQELLLRNSDDIETTIKAGYHFFRLLVEEARCNIDLPKPKIEIEEQEEIIEWTLCWGIKQILLKALKEMNIRSHVIESLVEDSDLTEMERIENWKKILQSITKENPFGVRYLVYRNKEWIVFTADFVRALKKENVEFAGGLGTIADLFGVDKDQRIRIGGKLYRVVLVDLDTLARFLVRGSTNF